MRITVESERRKANKKKEKKECKEISWSVGKRKKNEEEETWKRKGANGRMNQTWISFLLFCQIFGEAFSIRFLFLFLFFVFEFDSDF